MGVNINKQGIINSNLMTEFIANSYDKNFYVEPDKSVWMRIVHHNNPANAKFSSSNTFTTQVYLDEDRWFKASLCNYITNSWELMIKEKATVDGTEYKFRWIQSVNPMTTNAFEQTKASNITKIIDGYDISSSFGGCYALNTNTYLCCNNGTNGYWFGALGCWTNWSNGIPPYGFISSSYAIKTGYIDLYLRIDNANLDKVTFGEDYITSNEFIEI